LQTQVNFAICLQQLGNVESALTLLQSASAETIKNLGWSNQLTVQCHLGIAISFARLGRPNECHAAYEVLIEQLIANLGANHPSAVMAKRLFATTLAQDKRYAKAIECMQSVVAVLRETVGPNNAETMQAIQDLAGLLRSSGHYSEAAAFYKELIEIPKTEQDRDKDFRASNLYWLGICELQQKNHSNAEVCLRECWELRKLHSPGEWTTALAESALGESLLGQGNYELAKNHLLAALDALQVVRDAVSDADHERIMNDAIGRVVQFYELSGDSVQATTWRETITPPANQ
jgi:tetratricopeptide (TPR) repeat protein